MNKKIKVFLIGCVVCLCFFPTQVEAKPLFIDDLLLKLEPNECETQGFDLLEFPKYLNLFDKGNKEIVVSKLNTYDIADETEIQVGNIFIDLKGNSVLDDKNITYAFVESLDSSCIDTIIENNTLESLQIKDTSNLSIAELQRLYPYICKNNIELSAILLAYPKYADSYGNDGTPLYQQAVTQYCPSITVKRSCATVVSTILNASNYIDYASAGTAGLIDYFEKHSDEWVCLGALKEEDLVCGDVIFIDRKSHAQDYLTGKVNDSEFVMSYEEGLELVEQEIEESYDGGYDNMGHKDYSLEPPTGGYEEVFSPDQDGDGDINDWEAEYWECYWLKATGSVPSYDYYNTWKAEADAYKAYLVMEKVKQPTKKVTTTNTNVVIHDHIFMWLGNDVITKYYPDSSANIISGSYSENYSKARSAALSKYDFKGDYRVYRHK